MLHEVARGGEVFTTGVAEEFLDRMAGAWVLCVHVAARQADDELDLVPAYTYLLAVL